MTDRVYSVAALITEVNTLLEQGFQGVRVEGEVTNASTSGRGHVYFSLKDDSAALDCVMWASRARRMKFQVEDGTAVLALGSLTVYPQRGRFQMVVEDLQPQGIGALQLAFEQLKKKLETEGLFAEERKKDMPALPNRVGIVTSASGAALQDMLKVLRRFPNLEIFIAPAMVQGEGAAREIANAIRMLTDSNRVKVIIVGRGANLVLPPDDGLRIRVVAPRALRLTALAERENLDRRTAGVRLDEVDSSRAEFIRRQFHADLRDATLYDLVVDSARFGFGGSAELIYRALELRALIG